MKILYMATSKTICYFRSKIQIYSLKINSCKTTHHYLVLVLELIQIMEAKLTNLCNSEGIVDWRQLEILWANLVSPIVFKRNQVQVLNQVIIWDNLAQR